MTFIYQSGRTYRSFPDIKKESIRKTGCCLIGQVADTASK